MRPDPASVEVVHHGLHRHRDDCPAVGTCVDVCPRGCCVGIRCGSCGEVLFIVTAPDGRLRLIDHAPEVEW